jgi:hypothetical protein
MIAIARYISIGGDVDLQTALIAIGVIAISVALSAMAGFVLVRRGRDR